MRGFFVDVEVRVAARIEQPRDSAVPTAGWVFDPEARYEALRPAHVEARASVVGFRPLPAMLAKEILHA